MTTDSKSNTDVIVRYMIAKTSAVIYIAVVPYIFINPDTFKSINTTIEYLSVNVVIYEYNFMNTLKYLAAHIVANLIGVITSIAVYYDYIKHIASDTILKSVISSSDTFSFNYSHAFILIVSHIVCAISLTVISNTATSSNAHIKALIKSVVLFTISLASGAIIGPIGYTLPNIILYVSIVVVKGSYDIINTDLVIANCVTIIGILILYPIIAINIKFYWRNKYRRYIEYGLLRE